MKGQASSHGPYVAVQRYSLMNFHLNNHLNLWQMLWMKLWGWECDINISRDSAQSIRGILPKEETFKLTLLHTLGKTHFAPLCPSPSQWSPRGISSPSVSDYANCVIAPQWVLLLLLLLRYSWCTVFYVSGVQYIDSQILKVILHL